MKKVLMMMFAMFFMANTASAFSGGINWHTDYEKAKIEAQKASKPMVLFFTGSDWCHWCKKLDAEVFHDPEFAKAAGDKFIFVLLDFPSKGNQSAQEKEQNQKLKNKFSIQGFPTLIILDSNQQQVGTTGYSAGGGKAYANDLLKMVKQYTSYQETLENLDSGRPLAGAELKALYQKALEFRQEGEANRILQIGLKSEERQFFQLERYRLLVKEGAVHNAEASALKQELLGSDPSNDKKIHFQIAVIDFEATSKAVKKGQASPSSTIQPLLVYIEKFGAQDQENLWRLEMIVSQVFLDDKNYTESIKHAQAAFNAAPAHMKSDINIALQDVRSRQDTMTAESE